MMVFYSPDWTNTGFSFILLTVNLFRHSTLTEQGLYICLRHVHCSDSQQLSYIILRNQPICLLKKALVSRITVVTKKNGLFILEKGLCYIRRLRSVRKKGMAHGKRAWRYKKRAWRSTILKGPRVNTIW